MLNIGVTGRIVGLPINKQKDIEIKGLDPIDDKGNFPDNNGNFYGQINNIKNFFIIDSSNNYAPKPIVITQEQCIKYFESKKNIILPDIKLDTSAISIDPIDYFTYKFSSSIPNSSRYLINRWGFGNDNSHSIYPEHNESSFIYSFDCSSKRFVTIEFSILFNEGNIYKKNFILDLYKNLYRGVSDSLINRHILKDSILNPSFQDSIKWLSENYNKSQFKTVHYVAYERQCIPYIIKQFFPIANFYSIISEYNECFSDYETIQNICRIGNVNFQFPKDLNKLIQLNQIKISDKQLIELIIALSNGFYTYYTDLRIDSIHELFKDYYASYYVSYFIGKEKYIGYVILNQNNTIDQIFIKKEDVDYFHRIY